MKKSAFLLIFCFFFLFVGLNASFGAEGNPKHKTELSRKSKQLKKEREKKQKKQQKQIKKRRKETMKKQAKPDENVIRGLPCWQKSRRDKRK